VANPSLVLARRADCMRKVGNRALFDIPDENSKTRNPQRLNGL
jgi:hypothetical protein|tara:strand:+ start:76 stop:204 length:129 start_codon:yes stop_codon:yes gene_type:complete